VSLPPDELVTLPVCANHDWPGTMWIVAPFHMPAEWVSAESYSVPLEDEAEMRSAVALAGLDRLRVVFGQRASIIIWPSTNTWFFAIPRSQDCRAL
jgi:hypothetical protein